MTRPSLRASACAALLALGACTTVVRYTEDLVDPKTGRTLFTRTPATVGGLVGFLAGVPISVVAVPVTWTVYQFQSEAARDPMSTYLFPSFVLWRVGTLLGMPFDAVEWLAWRSWQPGEALTPEERERIEREIDERDRWSAIPVDPIYPRPPVAPRTSG